MKKIITPVLTSMFFAFCLYIHPVQGQKIVKKGAKYDTIIVKHTTSSAKKPTKAVAKPAAAMMSAALKIIFFILMFLRK